MKNHDSLSRETGESQGEVDFFSRLKETARLMVGVGSYENYRRHMQQHHRGAEPMSETEYFRYCQEARYPGKSGEIKRCPC